MGEVYKARHTSLDCTVAIKALPEHVVADPNSASLVKPRPSPG